MNAIQIIKSAVIGAIIIGFILVAFVHFLSEYSKRRGRKTFYEDNRKKEENNKDSRIFYLSFEEFEDYYYINPNKWRLNYGYFPQYIYRDEKGYTIIDICIFRSFRDQEMYAKFKSRRSEYGENTQIFEDFLKDARMDFDKARQEMEANYYLNLEEGENNND